LRAGSRKPLGIIGLLVATCVLLTGAQHAEQPWQDVLNRISAQSMRGHVAFLASDLLEGRDTPSRGLDIAAEYIAAQFRRAGLEEIGTNGYFQIDRTENDGKVRESRNVVGILRGSDPKLKDTCVILSAHYDHMGMLPVGEGDRVFHGANDDASGTASVIEIASALAESKTRPKRSILFLAFFGEEEGLLGSRYYAAHPIVPLAQTVADLNLEQMGRTDDPKGPQIRSARLTGFNYSDVGKILKLAGERTGIQVRGDGLNPDPYFERSDNLSFAEKGVPAHTLAVAFEFPDYHSVGDDWRKIDYENMARVDRMVALGVLMLADEAIPPHWNEENSAARKLKQASQPH
jgi:Zn-dependent M28 family amino/carboxypeptidase